MMNFCLHCGKKVKDCGEDEWSSGVWLYGCFGCETLYEEHRSSDSRRSFYWKKSDMTFPDWRILKNKRQKT